MSIAIEYWWAIAYWTIGFIISLIKMRDLMDLRTILFAAIIRWAVWPFDIYEFIKERK